MGIFLISSYLKDLNAIFDVRWTSKSGFHHVNKGRILGSAHYNYLKQCLILILAYLTCEKNAKT